MWPCRCVASSLVLPCSREKEERVLCRGVPYVGNRWITVFEEPLLKSQMCVCVPSTNKGLSRSHRVTVLKSHRQNRTSIIKGLFGLWRQNDAGTHTPWGLVCLSTGVCGLLVTRTAPRHCYCYDRGQFLGTTDRQTDCWRAWNWNLLLGSGCISITASPKAIWKVTVETGMPWQPVTGVIPRKEEKKGGDWIGGPCLALPAVVVMETEITAGDI